MDQRRDHGDIVFSRGPHPHDTLLCNEERHSRTIHQYWRHGVHFAGIWICEKLYYNKDKEGRLLWGVANAVCWGACCWNELWNCEGIGFEGARNRVMIQKFMAMADFVKEQARNLMEAEMPFIVSAPNFALGIFKNRNANNPLKFSTYSFNILLRHKMQA